MENKSFDVPWEWRAMDLRLGGVNHAVITNITNQHHSIAIIESAYNYINYTVILSAMVSGHTEVFYELLRAWGWNC